MLQIAQALDAELTRLERLRAIIASLANVPKILQRLAELPKTQERSLQTKPDAQPSAARPERRRQPRRQVKPRPVQNNRSVVSGALTAAIPAGPVVVSAAALSQQRRGQTDKVALAASKPVAAIESSPERADAMARDLSHRWLSRGNAI